MSIRHRLLAGALALIALVTVVPLARAQTQTQPIAPAPLMTPAIALAPGKHYSDPDNQLERLDRARIEYFIRELASVCNVELMVAVAPTLNGKKARTYADDLGMAWGVGKQYKGRGVLVLLAPKDGDSQLRVTEALNEMAIDDAEAQKILEANGVPQWKDHHWGAGLLAVVRAVDVKMRTILKKPAALEPTQQQLDAIEPPPPAPATAAATGSGGNMLPIILGVGAVAIVGIIVLVSRASKKARTCPKCNVMMNELGGADMIAALDTTQQAEQRCGAVRFEVRKCPQCGDRKIVSEHFDSTQWERCQPCNTRAARKVVSIMTQPTERTVGQRKIDVTCTACAKATTRYEEIAMIAPHAPGQGPRSSYTQDEKNQGSGFDGGGGGAKF